MRYQPPLIGLMNLRKPRVWLRVFFWLLFGINAIGAIAMGVPLSVVLTGYFVVTFGGMVLEWRRLRLRVTFTNEGFADLRAGVEIEHHFGQLAELNVTPPWISFLPQYRLTWVDRRGLEDGIQFWIWSPKKREAFEEWGSMARQRPDVASVRFVYE